MNGSRRDDCRVAGRERREFGLCEIRETGLTERLETGLPAADEGLCGGFRDAFDDRLEGAPAVRFELDAIRNREVHKGTGKAST